MRLPDLMSVGGAFPLLTTRHFRSKAPAEWRNPEFSTCVDVGSVISSSGSDSKNQRARKSILRTVPSKAKVRNLVAWHGCARAGDLFVANSDNYITPLKVSSRSIRHVQRASCFYGIFSGNHTETGN